MLNVIIFCFLTSTVITKHLGSIHVEGYGEVWIHGYETGEILVQNNGFTIIGATGLYFGTGPEDDMVWETPLMDRNFTYTVDMSSLACDCVTSAYFSAISNYDGSEYGPEYTVLEASSFAATSSLHLCEGL